MSTSNTHPQIQFLPAEILGQIFAFVVMSHKDSDSDLVEPRRLDATSYMSHRYNFMFVSRYWRSVALSTPCIWGILSLNNRKLFSFMLERSKTVEISVNDRLWQTTSVTKPLLREVMVEHTSRITELTASLDDSEFQALIAELKQRPPSFRPTILDLGIWRGENQVFPNVILVPHRLQRLHMRRLNLSWDPLQSFPHLTSLAISFSNSIGRQVSLLHFINSLRGMPVLESLALEHCLPPDSFVPLIQPVYFSRLRFLKITTNQDLPVVSNFLTLIAIPAATTLSIIINNLIHQGSALLVQLSYFTSSLHNLIRGSNPETEDFSSRCYDHIHVASISENGLAILASNSRSNCQVVLTMADKLSQESVMRNILYSFPQHGIRSLDLRFAVQGKTLLEISDTLPNLHSIELNDAAAPCFITTMLENYSLLPFQNIRTLTLRRTTFASHVNGCLEFLKLQQFLESRSKPNSKLQKLCIFSCDGIYDHDVQLLRGLIDVEWDGVEREPVL